MSASEQKTRVAILFGGKSAEHEVSLQSAKSIFEAIDRDKYEPVLIGIDKSGKWRLNDGERFLKAADDPRHISLQKSRDEIALTPGNVNQQFLNTRDAATSPAVDVVFPILHGPLGEDGTIQGLLKLAEIPFVGASVLGSAVGMDKDFAKRLLRDAGIPQGAFRTFGAHEAPISWDKIQSELGSPVFVKPANLGSSVGISKADSEETFQQAVAEAFSFDRKIVVEEFIDGREIECSVLGNDDPIASLPGEIIPTHDFYSYDAKYIDGQGARLEIPANLPKKIVEKIQKLSIHVFKTLNCEGMARVDFFVTKDEKIYVNEINTIPGFTKISMYPKLWEASGLPYSELIDRLIQLAIQRFRQEKRLKTSI